MKDFAARFGSPLASIRPRGARQLEARSPKLGRRLRLFDHLAFSQWIRLEADPAVLTFYGRPARIDRRPDSAGFQTHRRMNLRERVAITRSMLS